MRRACGRCIGLSFRIAPTVLAGAALILGFGPAPLSAQDSPGVDVIVGGAAPELERFAAQELCDYLAKLYGIQAHPHRQVSAGADAAFLIGSPETNASVRPVAGRERFREGHGPGPGPEKDPLGRTAGAGRRRRQPSGHVVGGLRVGGALGMCATSPTGTYCRSGRRNSSCRTWT